MPGLLPPSIGEGWSNDPDFYFVHQVWALHGLDCVREAAAHLGREEDRDWIADEHADFRAALLRAIDRGYVEEDGVARLAMVPAPERDINSSLTQQHIAFLVWPRAVEGIEEGRVERLFASYAEAFAPEGLLGYKVYPHHGLALRELLHRRGTYRAAGAWPVHAPHELELWQLRHGARPARAGTAGRGHSHLRALREAGDSHQRLGGDGRPRPQHRLRRSAARMGRRADSSPSSACSSCVRRGARSGCSKASRATGSTRAPASRSRTSRRTSARCRCAAKPRPTRSSSRSPARSRPRPRRSSST